jgi:BNR repeat protein
MRRLSLLLSMIALIAGALISSPVRAADTGVVDVTNSPHIAEGEEFVAVNPRDPSNIIVGSNLRQPFLQPDPFNVPLAENGTVSCGVWSSHNGGRSWSGGLKSAGGLSPIADPLVGLPVPNLNLPDEFVAPGNLISADQSIVFDRHGNAYFECVDFGAGTNGDATVDVYRSKDGGRTWSAPVVAFSQLETQILIDRPYLAIDDSGGPRDGTIYLTWETMFYQGWLPAVYARSSRDGAKTWGPVVRVDDNANRAMWDPRQYPVVGADGALSIVYDAAPLVSPVSFDPNADHVKLLVARSTDGGRTFSHSVVEPDAHRISSTDEAFSFFTELIAAIAADPAHARRTAVAWPDDRSGEARILMRYTRNGGKTWSSPIDVADDKPGHGNQHDHVALTYLPDGRLVVVWRDRRHGGGAFGGRFDVFARVFNVSRAGVLAPGKTIEITNGPQVPTTGTRGVMPSEYLSAAATQAGLAVSWDQLRGGLPDNMFRRVPLSVFGP